MYLAFDPGPDLGYALFNHAGQFLIGEIVRGLDEQPRRLNQLSQELPFFPTNNGEGYTVISEIWTAYNATAIMTKNAHDTILSEGMVRYFAVLLGAKYVTQKSDILKIGQKWSGLKIAKGKAHKDSHDTAARVHGEYFLRKNHIKPFTI